MDNDVLLTEKRISGTHCKITLGVQVHGPNGYDWKAGEEEPDVWIHDLDSSNGTFVCGKSSSELKPQVNGIRLAKGKRRLLQHGDEVSLGHAAAIDKHDVRWIFRSVGKKGARVGTSASGAVGMPSMVFDRYQITQT